MEDSFKVPEIFPKACKPDTKTENVKPEQELPYKVPKWSGATPANANYSFEVLKNGVIIDNVNNLQSRPYWMIGRLPVGTGIDISAAHPTVSRYHAVLQYKDPKSDESEDEAQGGWYIYDLDSTHGTFVNKMKVKPRIYVRVKVGYQLKLGNSTRNYILQGPSEDEDEASEFTITELREQKAEREAELRQKELEEKLQIEKEAKEKEEAGVSWGMAEDAEEEPDLAVNPFAATNNEELFLDDPKKTLRGFFEREGYDWEYRCDELSPGVFICRVELPVDDEYGKNIMCEVQHKGKKKECVVQCALEACRILDRHGVLRQANHEPRRAKKMERDSDSDDDTFFDRTGDVEKKRLQRMGVATQEALTFEQLTAQEKEILGKIQSKEKNLQVMVETEKRQRNEAEEDLDAFMDNLANSDSKVDKFAISALKTEVQSLKIELQKVQKLINIAKPSVTLPPLAAKTKLPLFGKRNAFAKNFFKKPEATAVTEKIEQTKEFEVEEDEDETEVKAGEAREAESVKQAEAVTSSSPSRLTSNQPQEIPEISPASVEPEEPSEPVVKKPKLDQAAKSQEPPQESSKKKKTRFRTRNRLRENVDINDDDEYIDEEKVSTWVAPSGQSGDGMTHLNEKYGY